MKVFDRGRMVCCLVLAVSLAGARGALADTLPEPTALDGRIEVAAQGLLALARQEAQGIALRQTLLQSAGAPSQQPEPSEESLRKRALILGIVGAGTAVAGIFVWRGDSGPNLPGITSGRKVTGQMMVGGGTAMAALGFIRAFR